MLKRNLTMLLAMIAVSSAVLSCGETAEKTPEIENDDTVPVSETEAGTEAADSLSLRKLVSDDLDEYDFGGQKYRIVTCSGYSEFHDTEATTGDVINDAVFARNAAVEERFNCEITVVKDEFYEETAKYMTDCITSGEDAFDLASFHMIMAGTLVPSDYFLNWYDIPHIDFSKPWWSDSTVSDLTYGGDVCITAIGDMALSALARTYCVFYNKNLGTNFDIPDLFPIVYDGKFTIDYLTQLSRDIYTDLNQNGNEDNDDLYGYTSSTYSNIDAYLWSFDNPVFRQKNEKLEYVYPTEKVSSIVEKLCAVFSDNKGIRTDPDYSTPTSTSHYYSADMFAMGKSVFANGQIGFSLSRFRELKDAFSILPYPKWDEAQENYMTMADGGHEVMIIPATLSDPEFLGVITEAMCAESYKILVPAYYDVALKVKGARDEDSVAMLDMLVNSRIFDFGYVYDAWKGSSFILETLVRENNVNFDSYYKSKEKSIMKWYSQILDYFESKHS